MNPSPNWMLAQVVFLLAACQRHPNDLPRDGGREAEALSSSTSTLARGNIGGHAKLRGVVPAPRVVRLPSELERSCGRSASDQTLRVASQGSLADVVVFLEDESALSNEKSAADLLPTVVDQRGCVFWPPVSVAPTDGALELVNSDPLLHNVRANVGSEGLFNFAMPIQGLRSRKRLPSRPGIVRLNCDVHPWMQAVIRTFDHPFFAITDQSGEYQLTKVPSGRHKLTFWHPRLPQQTFELETAKGKTIQDVAWSSEELAGE